MHTNRPPRGFTLVELMVVLVVLAVLVSLGLPSFRSSIDSNRVATATNELTAALSLARSEAMRSTRQSIICPSTDGASCGTNWNAGMLVAGDANGDGTPDAPIRFIQAKPGVAVTVTGATNNRLVINGRGIPGGTGAAMQIQLQPSECSAGRDLRRTLSMTGAGQVKLQKGACS